MRMRDAAATPEAAKEGPGLARPVLALVENPEDFATRLGCPWLELDCETTVAGFLDRLGRQPVSGFVLEVDAVLRAAALERGLLFELAGAFPLLRVRSSGKGDLKILDDPESFVQQVRGQSPRPARHVPRVPVLLRAELRRTRGLSASAANVAGSSAFSAPRGAPLHGAGVEGQPALFLDLSPCGGALGCDVLLTPGEELDLRILELKDSAPVAALVCWSGQRGSRSGRRCAGVRFLNMLPGQASELVEHRLRAAAS